MVFVAKGCKIEILSQFFLGPPVLRTFLVFCIVAIEFLIYRIFFISIFIFIFFFTFIFHLSSSSGVPQRSHLGPLIFLLIDLETLTKCRNYAMTFFCTWSVNGSRLSAGYPCLTQPLRSFKVPYTYVAQTSPNELRLIWPSE